MDPLRITNHVWTTYLNDRKIEVSNWSLRVRRDTHHQGYIRQMLALSCAPHEPVRMLSQAMASTGQETRTREDFMSAYTRAMHGAEAGAIAALALEGAFFLLDAVRLTPLATPVALSGAVPGPGGFPVDLTSISGVLAILWSTYQILLLTAVHLLAFGAVGVLAGLLFDWSEPTDAGQIAVVTVLCTLAFYGTVALSGSVVALASVGWGVVVTMNLLAALMLTGSLRLVSTGGAAIERGRP